MSVGGCDTTSFDHYEYTWEAQDNCVLAIHRNEDDNMIKQGKNIYYIVSGRNNTSQYLFEVKTEPKIFCKKTSTSIPDQLRFAIRGYRLWGICSGFWEKNGILRRNTTSTILPAFSFVTAGYSYTNLSHPIQITLIQEHLITSTWIMNSNKEPNWITYSSKAQRCFKAPRYNFRRTYANKKEPKF